MKKIITFCFCLLFTFLRAQINYSDNWEDLFSYNNVKEIKTAENMLYALSDNGVFIYDFKSEDLQKMSSIDGLSGEETSAIFYDKNTEKLIIGYESGLIEVIDKKGNVTVSPDITKFNQSGAKRINSIYKHDNIIYIATSFAIVGYTIEKNEFGDTYFIGENSTAVNVKSVTGVNTKIYAGTSNGIYVADTNDSNLLDSSKWKLLVQGDFTKLVTFNNNVYTFSGNELKKIEGNTLTTIQLFSEGITTLTSSSENLVVTLPKKVVILNKSLVSVGENQVNSTLNTAQVFGDEILLGTTTKGILMGVIGNSQGYKEIHPQGPISNDIFNMDVYNNELWLVYGGYNEYYAPLNQTKGYSYFKAGDWVNVESPYSDLNYVTIDKTSENKVFMSSFGNSSDVRSPLTGGLLTLENGQVTEFFNRRNSPLDVIPNSTSTRVSATAFDNNDNLWIVSVATPRKLHKLTPSKEWSSFNLSNIELNESKIGVSNLVIDKSNTLWIATRQNGLRVFNEKGDRRLVFSTDPTKGNLPNATVKGLAIDKQNKVWIGTINGLVVYNDALTIFEKDAYKADPVVILDEGVPQKLLGNQAVNSIAVDGANSKWFGTETSGVFYTNSDGQKTLAHFDKNNSPLPSNKILSIKVDDSTGKVYILTDKGMVVYTSGVAPFGEALGEVYAYPNPVFKNHDVVKIDGRNGTHLPKGTNIKILDISGNLVYETNIVEGQENEGGRAIWDKRNLAGNKVASGVYIVLLTNEDGSETSTTKIAIIN